MTPDATLAILAEAIGGRRVTASHRVMASAESRSPGEGLALLAAYVSVADVKVRQAILDAGLAITGTNPFR